ncbi:adenosine-specific kinase [Athalassotoga saccharophila]|uniref:adenosine-specific kinase n=1 Tax=Athalassotoga saccharophila TaxID=1441386 RepID=UPI00137AD871|nr:adenosine-specific kinase [Athalassotoga saccharophila]BBJ27791.1 adenosine specific kinase [Athalassotoga saccharophila]
MIDFDVVDIKIPKDANIIIGQTHFIKTVEDLYEVMATASPNAKFGLAFNEASGPCLIRHDGNDGELENVAIENAQAIGAGHIFVLLMREIYPISVLNSVKSLQEVCNIYAATANPLQIVVGITNQGRGIMGVIDGFPPKGVEKDEDISKRKVLLRQIIKYKR